MLWLSLLFPLFAADSSGIGQFGATIFIGGPWDFGRCTQMVDNANQRGSIRFVEFVPTFYWWDDGPKQPWPSGFDPSCKNSNLSSYYCYSRFNATTVNHWCYTRQDGNCPEVTPSEIDAFKSSIGPCMKYAADKGLNVAVNARVDDGRSLGGWRNTLDFSPTQRSGQYTYEEAILNPLADMLASAAQPGTQVAFAPQGEMGATVFFHPSDWQGVLQRMRQRIEQGRSGGQGEVLVGLGTNNLKACGCRLIGILDADQYLDALEKSLDTSMLDLSAIKDTYMAADFLGVSAYIAVPQPNFQVCDLEGLLSRMDRELTLYGISLKDFLASGKEIRYSEYGVGGGTSQNGDQKATTAEQAAFTPFFGINGPYSCDKDPFDMCHQDEPSPVRDYRRYFFNASAQYFKENGCEYHGVKVAYLWGTGSWDVLAIYPGDTSGEGSWTDPVVVQTIASHNQYAQSGGG